MCRKVCADLVSPTHFPNSVAIWQLFIISESDNIIQIFKETNLGNEHSVKCNELSKYQKILTLNFSFIINRIFSSIQ